MYHRIGSDISPCSRWKKRGQFLEQWFFLPKLNQLTSPVLQTAQEFVELFVRGVRLLATQLHGALRPFMLLLLPGRAEFWISPVLARFWPVQRGSGCHYDLSFLERDFEGETRKRNNDDTTHLITRKKTRLVAAKQRRRYTATRLVKFRLCNLCCTSLQIFARLETIWKVTSY